MSPEVRGLGARWKLILTRVPAYMAGVSMDGVPLSAFEDACLSPVAPSDRPAIIQALKAKRLIFPVRNGAAWRVYPAKPVSRRFSKPTDTALDQFLRAVSPHMHRLAEIIAAGHGSADRENRLQEAEACRLLAGLMQRHFDKGLSLGDARDALWRTFNADVMAVVSRREWTLRTDSKAVAVAPRRAKPKKARANAEIEERIVGLVEKAGSEGITKTDLGRSLGKARPPVAELDAMIVSLEGTGMLQTGTMKLTRRGRPGFRLFSGQIEMPRVMSDGLAVFA